MAPTVAIAGLRFHYWQGGDGDDVVLIHGVGSNLAMWHFSIAADLLETQRVTMYDLRGHGYSEAPAEGYTVTDMVGDLLAILDTLGLDRVSLVGHSFGADIALHLALGHPDRVRRLVAIEAGLPSLFRSRRHAEWTGWNEWTHLLEAEASLRKEPREWHRIYTRLRRDRELDAGDFTSDPRLRPRARRLIHLLTQTSMVQDYERTSSLTRGDLAALTPPLLLVYGEDSSYRATLPLLHSCVPEAAELIVPGADHFTVLQRRIAEPIRSFLEA